MKGAAAAVATLTVGIAAARAMFALVDGVLLRRLPVRDQSSLSVLAATGAVLVSASLMACALPAWRAGRTNPAEGLRET